MPLGYKGPSHLFCWGIKLTTPPQGSEVYSGIHRLIVLHTLSPRWSDSPTLQFHCPTSPTPGLTLNSHLAHSFYPQYSRHDWPSGTADLVNLKWTSKHFRDSVLGNTRGFLLAKSYFNLIHFPAIVECVMCDEHLVYVQNAVVKLYHASTCYLTLFFTVNVNVKGYGWHNITMLGFF